VEYPGWVLAVDSAQALEIDHELGHHDGAAPLAHTRELWHVLPVRCARGANDGDRGARGEAGGEEDDPHPACWETAEGHLATSEAQEVAAASSAQGSLAKATASSQAVRPSAQASLAMLSELAVLCE
jgi:hypothetical protein